MPGCGKGFGQQWELLGSEPGCDCCHTWWSWGRAKISAFCCHFFHPSFSAPFPPQMKLGAPRPLSPAEGTPAQAGASSMGFWCVCRSVQGLWLPRAAVTPPVFPSHHRLLAAPPFSVWAGKCTQGKQTPLPPTASASGFPALARQWDAQLFPPVSHGCAARAVPSTGPQGPPRSCPQLKPPRTSLRPENPQEPPKPPGGSSVVLSPRACPFLTLSFRNFREKKGSWKRAAL